MSNQETALTDELMQRIADLYATDPEFAAAQPDEAVSAAVDEPGMRLPDMMRTVMEAYADRPALGQRAVEYVTDAAGRTTARLLPRYDTVTFGEVWQQIQAIDNDLLGGPDAIAPGDRVAVLGFTSAEYTIIDTSLARAGVVAVPLQTSAPAEQLRPILDETEPVALFADVKFLDEAVELAVGASAALKRVVVFDYRAQVDDEREAVEHAVARLAERGVVVETLADVVARGAALPAVEPPALSDPDPLLVLIYTSGSTGTPKGAMYPERLVTNSWRTGGMNRTPALPSIVLSFLPMSHMMGRGTVYRSIAHGGTVYFAAKSDLSTLLEDIALVRPTQMTFVPRVWEMIHQEVQSEVDRRALDGVSEQQVLDERRVSLFGGRQIVAMTGSAPISPELKAWVQKLVGLELLEAYGSTEAGGVMISGHINRPPVLDYKLVDVPELGYLLTDRPHPRGELLLKSTDLIPGYYKRPDVTADVFDEDGFYRSGDIVAELGPDYLQYLDRRNNVLKLAQGEFVTVSKLEAAFGTSPLISQIYVYGNSSRSYLLAVIVPSSEALGGAADPEALRPELTDALQTVARESGLQSYEVPRDFIIETEPFTLENGLLTGVRKLAWPKLKARYGAELEQLYAELAEGQAAELRALRSLKAADAPVLDTVLRAVGATIGAASSDLAGDAHFTDLGGDSLSALTFGNLLEEIFEVEVPVGVIVSPATDLAGVAAYIEGERSAGSKRPTFSRVHGKNAAEARAADLTLDKFIDAATLAAAPSLPGPASEIRTVLLTGATGFLGRYLALEWLERMDLVGGKVICLVRAKSDADARARLDATFDSGDPKLLAHYRKLADHLEVIAGDKGEANLGLSQEVWQRLADTVDLIVDPAALVNHVLPYSELFGPNALGTAELIRIALTTRIKPFAYVSTIAVGSGVAPGEFVEATDVRTMSPVRAVDDSYANGYGNSKWAGEVLLREANDLCGLPVSVYRCDMILADTTYAGQLNLPDMFTRMMLSLVATGIAPKSFYELDAEGNRQRAHYDGLPVEFISEAISTLTVQVAAGESESTFETYHVMNPYDDGIGMDEYVDWLIAAGYSIARVDDYADWLTRFETGLRGLPDRQRQASLLPLLHNYQQPGYPVRGSIAPVERFRAAVQNAKIGVDKDIPHIDAPVIVKYITDLQLLGLL
ncbi:carboxylic acid reductase [Mycobacterium sp. CBMA293]|uniref:carboxylic acid reductase n=1 Tax=unclassified Mycolicibacterium TaxID=2636767 RepID=UPI0012DCA9DE|nr:MULTISPECIES: carboxylic acid reductase [unclassified Mycolicibacterium]MUL47336.1 carboxylic acid reductase [Mycolicibacterium sp. CBMA 360]MUL61449.1 carboxylic acid reductase [Mycolicibacterium sp. CBMA 335]MUL72184.1 carboxylic acid reductase [Mycolicibacterium sp. CBMA 311]MUL96351.1 carboxylic acid reductase [Mycolicibacterium sp. CBMA 230]MUM08826.1 oxidoreductase [Mycolicibacterium sp. CBMA 213]